ncbi:transcription termination/antitermination protein NusA, partial [Bacillus spizizenii]|nr:transcription termination/antitermination protein NusA [Bacillus spizizenii]
KIEDLLPFFEQMPNESYKPHVRIKVYITNVEKTTKGPQFYVSRTHPGLLKRLFEIVVPEIYVGTVELKSVAREAGDR